ncbi:unnamed protein product [Trichobilharzia szidati]|nr:unnamed protein product [Trichobilharzia szidati]
MVHFAYSHIVFFTLLALTAINSGESTSKDAISARLAKINDFILKEEPHFQGNMKTCKQVKFIEMMDYLF